VSVPGSTAGEADKRASLCGSFGGRTSSIAVMLGSYRRSQAVKGEGTVSELRSKCVVPMLLRRQVNCSRLGPAEQHGRSATLRVPQCL
jgi:hypothetical protein